LSGQTVYDPFTGSAAVLEAAYKLQLFSIGVEIDDAAHAMALGRMARVIAEKTNEQKTTTSK
jgi:DNA modification methylase